MSLEKAKQLTKIDDELLSLVKTNLAKLEFGEDNSIEEFEFSVDEATFSFIELNDDGWYDNGKYQNNSYYYQLVCFDKTKAKYPCDNSIVAEYDLGVCVNVSRNGSYYSDYYYDYKKPQMFKYHIEVIPEVVIPEHEELTKIYL